VIYVKATGTLSSGNEGKYDVPVEKEIKITWTPS
jgi:hypothetical protein